MLGPLCGGSCSRPPHPHPGATLSLSSRGLRTIFRDTGRPHSVTQGLKRGGPGLTESKAKRWLTSSTNSKCLMMWIFLKKSSVRTATGRKGWRALHTGAGGWGDVRLLVSQSAVRPSVRPSGKTAAEGPPRVQKRAGRARLHRRVRGQGLHLAHHPREHLVHHPLALGRDLQGRAAPLAKEAALRTPYGTRSRGCCGCTGPGAGPGARRPPCPRSPAARAPRSPR